MASLIDTNVLVYAYDPRSPEKQRIASRFLRQAVIGGDSHLPHQAIIEFVAAVVRPRKDLGGKPLLPLPAANAAVTRMMDDFEVIYPDPEVVRTALAAAATYQLSWYDAHLLAYALVNGLDEIFTEDFEHGRYYGGVRTHDPFLAASDSVHELPAMYDPS